MPFSKFLHDLQKSQNLSTVAWAAASGVSRSSLSRWLHGHALPRDKELEDALKVFGVDSAQQTEAFALLEAERGKGVIRLQKQVGLPLTDRSVLLIALRERLGWTQGEAADRAQIPRTTLSRWESGATWPSSERLQGLCYLYGVSEEELLSLTTSPLSEEPAHTFDLAHCRETLTREVLALGSSPLPLLLLAVQLSQLVTTLPEASSLLYCVYLGIANKTPYTLKHSVADRYEQKAALMQVSSSEATLYLALLKAHTLRYRYTYGVAAQRIHNLTAPPPHPNKAPTQNLSQIGYHNYQNLMDLSELVFTLPSELQESWYHELIYATALMKDRKESQRLLQECRQRFGENNPFREIFLTEWMLLELGDYTTLLERSYLTDYANRWPSDERQQSLQRYRFNLNQALATQIKA